MFVVGTWLHDYLLVLLWLCKWELIYEYFIYIHVILFFIDNYSATHSDTTPVSWKIYSELKGILKSETIFTYFFISYVIITVLSGYYACFLFTLHIYIPVFIICMCTCITVGESYYYPTVIIYSVVYWESLWSNIALMFHSQNKYEPWVTNVLVWNLMDTPKSP